MIELASDWVRKPKAHRPIQEMDVRSVKPVKDVMLIIGDAYE